MDAASFIAGALVSAAVLGLIFWTLLSTERVRFLDHRDRRFLRWYRMEGGHGIRD